MIRHVLLSCVGCVLVALLPAKAAGAEQLPIRKAGLWEIKMVRTGSPLPAITMQHCTDATTDRDMNGVASPTAQQACSKQDLRKTATGYASDTVCTVAGRTITSHSDVTGDFNSAYTVTTVSHSEGGSAGARDSTSKIEAKWIGACKPDQKPGDVVMPDGRKVNVIDLQKRQSPLPTR
jgi:Protein of unknown function (DUF3617)